MSKTKTLVWIWIVGIGVGGMLCTSVSAAQIISSITVHNSSSSGLQISSVPLAEDAPAMVDRTHEYNNVPSELVGIEYVKVANDDKTVANYALDVTLAKEAILYLFLDNRLGHGDIPGNDPDLVPELALAGMTWVLEAEFQDTGLTIGIDEAGDSDIDQWSVVYAKPVPSGTVRLWQQNDLTHASGRNMYGVAAKEMSCGKISYQGRLTDSGNPAEGPYDLQFKLFDAETDGNQIGMGTITKDDVTIRNGYFTVTLNFGDEVFTGDPLWLEIGVRPGELAYPHQYTILTPRQEITPTPYAFYARNLGGQKDSDWIITQSNMYAGVSGNVGIGTTNPGQKLSVIGPVRCSYGVDEAEHIQMGHGGHNGYINWVGDGNLDFRYDQSTLASFTPEGKFGIGTVPSEKLTVSGMIHSTTGGFKFPDGSVQTSAVSTKRTPQQIALLKWYEANQSDLAYTTGGVSPYDVAFDGTHIWVANWLYGGVSKLRVSDGSLVDTYPAGINPYKVAFDGAHMWVTDPLNNVVTKLRASNGELVETYEVVGGPGGIAFDGIHIWVANYYDGNVKKLLAYDGSVEGTFPVGDHPVDVAFDGTHIWVANSGANTVTKLRASDGSKVETYDMGGEPYAVVFDGTHIWVANSDANTVTKLRASDGSEVGTYNVGDGPNALVFDGAYIWVTNNYSDDVTKLRASDGSVVGTYAVGNSPRGIAFDGAHIWVTNENDNTVSKL